MPRTKPTGIPARAILAGGITSHGPHCCCAFCAQDIVATDRQAIPVVRAAGVVQPPIQCRICGGVPCALRCQVAADTTDSLVSVEACS